MLNKNQRGIAHLLILLILAVGVIVGLYLIKNPQILKSRASSSPISGPISSYPVYSTYPGPIGFWSFDEAGTTDLTRQVGSGGSGEWFTAGKIGKASIFNGTDDYWYCSDAVCGGPNKLDIGTDKMTIEAWIKPNSLVHAGIAGKYNTSSDTFSSTKRSYNLVIQTNTGNIGFALTTSGGKHAHLTTTSSIASGVWSHVAGVYDGSSMKVYINGVLDSATVAQNGIIEDSNAPFYIGTYRDSADAHNYFPGQIDEVRIYNYALTQSQIQSDMNPGNSPSSTPTPTATITPTVSASPTQGAIDQRVAELENKINEQQSLLDKITSWIKSIFPGF